jgi:hypothetical protein
MTDVRNSGYKAAAQTALSTELNSLANDTWCSLSAEIDNSTNGYMFADFEVNLAAAIFDGADAAVELYLVPSLDDTNFPTFLDSGSTDNQENNQYFIGSVTVRDDDASVTSRGTLRGVELPPGKFKIGARNRTNIGLASSGNTVKWRPWQYSSV